MSRHIKVDGKKYFLAHNFELVSELENNTDIRLRKLYKAICEEDEKAIDLAVVLTYALYGERDKNKLDFDKCQDLAESIFDTEGYTAISLFIHDLILEVIVGEASAKKLRSARMYDEITSMISSHFKNSKKALLLWAGISLISIGSVCGIISLFKLGF